MKESIHLLPHRKEHCLLMKSAFTADFCDRIIAEKKDSFKKAITNYPTSYRNNERQVTDDKKFSIQLFEEIRKHIPTEIEIKGISLAEKGIWKLDHLNPRIRICRYLSGQYFHKHLDGVHYISESQQSKLTFMIYLNGKEDFTGGKTLFFNSKEDETVIGSYEAKKGDLIIFDHNLWHSGAMVIKGEKYILRSDIIYRKVGGENKKVNVFCGEGHLGYIWTATVWNDRLLTSGRDKKIKIWSSEGIKIDEISGHESSILCVVNFDKKTMLSASRDGTIKIWNYNLKLNQIDLVHSAIYCQGAILAICKMDDQTFLSGGADGQLNQIKITGEKLNSIKAHDEWIWGIAKITSDCFATISEDGSLKIWNINDSNPMATWKESIPINSIAVEDSKIYLGRFDGSILLFNFEIEQRKLSLENRKTCHTGIIRKLLIKDKYLYSTSEDCTAKVWEKASLKFIETFQHKNFVQDVAIFDDALITVSYDGEIKKHKTID